MARCVRVAWRSKSEVELVQECNEIYNEDAIPADAFTTGKRAVL